jgi:hypothetical protein
MVSFVKAVKIFVFLTHVLVILTIHADRSGPAICV